MRIVIDMQGAQTESRYRGIGRYSYSIVQSIVRNAPNHEVWLIANAKLPESIPEIREAFNGLVPNEQIRIFDVPHSEKTDDWSNLAAEVIREDFIEALNPDVILITSVFEGHWSNAVTSIGAYACSQKTVVILYDLIPFIYPDKYLPSPELKEYYYRKIDWINNADLLLAISDSSRSEAIKHLGIDEDKVINISTAIDPQFGTELPESNNDSVLLKNLGINGGFVLYTPGGFDSRKNFSRLIEAFSLLPRHIRFSYQLVIVSKLNEQQRDELNKIAIKHGLSQKELVLTNYVDDKTLIKLYKNASLFVFPSLHEGFGLPVLEAMACGVPVIGSNVTSIPEVIGLPEALFNPKLVEDITDKVLRGLTDKAFRELLLVHQRKQVARFSWDKTAQIAISAFEELHNQPKQVKKELQNIIDFIGQLPQKNKVEDFRLREVANCIAFNQIKERRQLLLDISTIVHVDARSGIQRVVRSLLKQLLGNACEGFEVKPIYFDGDIYRYANKYCQKTFNDKIAEDDTPIAISQGDIYLSLDLNMHLSSITQKLHENLNHHGVRMVYIVYDILLARHPEWWESQNADLFLSWLKNIGEVATDLICISHAVADDVIEWFKERPPARLEFGPNIHSFHLGADVENSLPSRGMPSSDKCILNKISGMQTFLMVGTIEPRKGHEQVLDAFEQLWANQRNVNLVIVGRQGWKVNELINRIKLHPESGKYIFWLDDISDEYLEKIYATSTCLIAASYGEGFGLPLIEAAQHKLPIFARNIPVFREVAGPHAFYFDANEPEGLAAAIENWIKLYNKSLHPTSEDMPWLTWEQSTQQLLNVLLADRTKSNELLCVKGTLD